MSGSAKVARPRNTMYLRLDFQTMTREGGVAVSAMPKISEEFFPISSIYLYNSVIPNSLQ